MSKKVLIYAGTTEGRLLAGILANAGVDTMVCVATEYGEWMMEPHPLIEVKVGRQSSEEMEKLLRREEPVAVVDATHPFATQVTAQLKEIADRVGVIYLRLQRETHVAPREGEQIMYVSSAKECADRLAETEGNILLTTGSKDLEIYAENPTLRERLYVRVLPGAESLALCEKAGLVGRQIIALQGPFSRELNLALIHQYRIKYLVTKESGRMGGLGEKLEAAMDAGIRTYLIGSPKEEGGLEVAEVLKQLSTLLDRPLHRPEGRITLVGAGMGKLELTEEGQQAIQTAEVLFGAPRLLAPYEIEKETRPYYLARDILPCMEQMRQEKGVLGNVTILFSGDTGFYSGAEKLYNALLENGYKDVRIVPGISAVGALSARCGIAWQDAALFSIHGKERGTWEASVIERVQHNSKTILLLSDRKQATALCEVLAEAGLGRCNMYFGYQLSYPEEMVQEYAVEEWPERLSDYPEAGLYTAMLLNEEPEKRKYSYGWPEEAFVRGKVPMTKEEVRSIVLGKLRLREGNIVYDIGSGTGSVAVEIAALSSTLEVYALECKEEGCALIEANRERYHCSNLHLVPGMAPESFAGLPVPDVAFIGGSKGRLIEILQALYERNPQMRVVATAISLETISELSEVRQHFSLGSYEMVQVQVSRGRNVGDYQLMQGENPIFIVTLQF